MSMSPMRLIANNSNVLRDAILAASSVRASKAFGTRALTRVGNGRAVVVGEYTGMDDATLDIEIMAGGGTPRASVPTFSGVGSGELLISGVTSAVVQEELTLTLVDMGTITAAASLVVGSVVLRDKTPGASGNAINVSVTPALTKTAAPMATLEDWPASTSLQTSGAWAGLGGLPLSASGEINPATPRLIFGNDVTVYRPYTTIENGALKYGLSPAVERDIPEGAQVYNVTGGYTIAVTEGSTVETYTAETFYEWLTAMSASALIEVAGVVIADLTPGGMGAVDVPLRTTAFISAFDGIKLTSPTAATTAPTERVTIECINNTRVGGELWKVSGTASGELGTATTGQAFASPSVLFTVPTMAAELPKGAVGTKYVPVSRGDGEGVPGVCFNPIALGVAATRGSTTWTYKARPPADCPCEGQSAGIISDKCLGLTLGGGDMGTIPSTIAARVVALQDWAQNLISQQADFQATQNVAVAKYDMDLIEGALAEYQTALVEMAESPAGLAEWDIKFAALQVEMAVLGGVLANTPTAALINYSVGYSYVSQNGVIATVTGITVSGTAATEAQIITGQSPNLISWPTTGTFTITGDNGGLYPVIVSMTVSTSTDGDIYRAQYPAEVSQILRKYTAQMNHCRAVGGILPKSDAGPDGDGCWQDNGDAFWWEDNNGVYAPAFSNEIYYASKKGADGGWFSTQEFAFGLAVSCPERLKEGDQVTFSIDSTDGVKPYQIGDKATLTVYGGAPAFLTGGVDGSDTQTWALSGSVSGGMADYMLPVAGAIYTGTGTGFNLTLTPGGIPFELGDGFTWSFEAGQYRWRKNSGAWSAAADIPVSGTSALTDGLSLDFYPAAAPSFVAGDAYRCTIMQPYAPSHTLAPTRDYAWEWTGASASMTLALPAPTSVSLLAAALVSLPAGATLSMGASTDGTTYTYYTMPASGVAILPATVIATHIRVSVTGAPGGHIGWLWAGEPFATEAAPKIELNYQWNMTRGASLNPTGMMAGLGVGSVIQWEEDSSLLHTDKAPLIEIITHCQSNDEPILLVPHILYPDEATLCRVDFSELTLSDWLGFRNDESSMRYMAATLPLTAWLS